MKTISDYPSVNNLHIIVILGFVITSTHANLAATYATTKLPTTDYSHRVGYDGEDGVYLFGRGISKYSLSTDTIHFLTNSRISSRHGSIHFDSDGNIFYFGADSMNDDKVLKYSQSTDSTHVVATLPYDIFGIPTIKLDNNTVLIFGRWEKGLDIVSFDFGESKATTLRTRLPTSFCYGAAVRFGTDKAYLFTLEGFMYEMDLQGMTFKRNYNFVLPTFERYPAAVTDGRFIYVVGKFKISSQYTDHEGIFQIDPVSMTKTFIHVDNWPVNYDFVPPALYIPRMNRIYCFVGQGATREADSAHQRDASDIFFIDLSPLANQAGPFTTEASTTQSTRTMEKFTETTTRAMQQPTTKTTTKTTISIVPPVKAGYTFVCSSSPEGEESSKCSLIDNPIHAQLPVCPLFKSSENASCHRVLLSDELHNYVGEDVNLLVTSLFGMECSFLINLILDDMESVLHCRLQNGDTLGLSFVPGEEETQILHYVVIVVLLIFGMGVTGWGLWYYAKKNKTRINHSVLWEADKDVEME